MKTGLDCTQLNKTAIMIDPYNKSNTI